MIDWEGIILRKVLSGQCDVVDLFVCWGWMVVLMVANDDGKINWNKNEKKNKNKRIKFQECAFWLVGDCRLSTVGQPCSVTLLGH